MNANSSLLDDCNCFALRQAARYITQLYERRLGQLGVTAAQYTILGKLKGSSSSTMAELAEHMVMERTTLLRALKPLQRDGYVTSGKNASDGKAFGFQLTEAGRTLYQLASVEWKTAQSGFEADFGRARAKMLRKALFELTDAV
ncbi:MarR family winged helix-turn-helix transcriptional regulator [Paraburkholderia sp. C35]|uniref:MarR family winged helix-turn-helix transcriptional regulator n=1 Tax=Paraburkholderia sp. C35 TaxID=2126993 RepID=UPI000D69788D|nr:MarR family winged helix-turn-helix transcriptional regulator [Paraburkholderia sp. C35]